MIDLQEIVKRLKVGGKNGYLIDADAFLELERIANDSNALAACLVNEFRKSGKAHTVIIVTENDLEAEAQTDSGKVIVVDLAYVDKASFGVWPPIVNRMDFTANEDMKHNLAVTPDDFENAKEIFNYYLDEFGNPISLV